MASKKLLLILGALFPVISIASPIELFAKGLVSRSYLDSSKWTTSVTASTGFGVSLFSSIRLEARYTNMSSLQNKFSHTSATTTFFLNDIKSETVSYSIGVGIDFLGERYPFQPFIFIGGGYLETSRSYYVRGSEDGEAVFAADPKKYGVSANLGAGFRVRIAKSIAFEVDAFAYGIEEEKGKPLIDWTGTVGIRVYL